MKNAIELIGHLKHAITAYSTFSDNVADENHEVFVKANKNVPGKTTLLGETWKGKYTAEDIAFQLEGYLLAIQDILDDKTN